MSADLNINDGGYMTDAEHEATKASLRAEIANAKESLDMPVLPTADAYRHGMNKMRAKINCPVLSTDDQALADELLAFDATAQTHDDNHIEYTREHLMLATAQTHDDLPPVDRLNVDEYLKQQYQANMLARYPNFEAATENDIATLKLKVDQMFVFNTVIVVFLAVLSALGFWLIMLMV